MSQFVETPTKAFTAGAAIGQYLRVKLSSGVLAVAGATDISLGTLEEASFASGDVRAVRLKTAQGTKKAMANGAVTAGTLVYGATGGMVSATANGNVEGLALDPATTSGDVIEIMPIEVSDASASVVATTAGQKINFGSTALDGSNPTSVPHGLTTCTSFVTTLVKSSAPGVGTSTVTANINGANVDCYAWMPTSNSNPTLVASTGTETFYWVACGA